VTPLPGTKAAVDGGCRCFRPKGSWDWDWSFCSMHAPRVPQGPGLCEHGEYRSRCTECADRRAGNEAFTEDMRTIRPQSEDAFGRRVER
jgi:hypothetical protein